MGQADYYLEGSWNFYCQECGKKLKAAEGLHRWDNFWVGPECWEIRNPQDFIRGIPDNPSVPWSTGNVPPIFVSDAGTPTENSAGSMQLNSYQLGSKPLG